MIGSRRIEATGKLIFATLVVTLFLPACRDPESTSESAAVALSLSPPPTPEETGGRDTEFYFEYLFGGGVLNAAFDIVVVTTNKNIVVPKDRFLRDNEGPFGTTNVVYVVSPSIAKDIDALLSQRGFFAWKSTPDGSLSDDNVWKLVAKTPSGNHRVVLSSYFDERVADDFFQGARHTIRENDSEATVLAKNVFNLIGDVRRLTQSQGERIYASEAVLAAELRGN